MIFKKINFKLMSIILLFFCTTLIKCKHVEKRSIMQELMSNFMQMIDPKSNQKQNMPYKIIKSETVDGKVQKYFYTVPNVDDEKMKDLNNAIKLLSIQSMLNRHYKNQYRKHKMMKEIEHLSKGNENHPELKKLNEHTIKKYKYINNYNNHRFNKEMLRLQKQAQKLIDNSPELFKNVQDHHFIVQNAQDNLNTKPEFYTNSHGPEQSLMSHHNNEQSTNTQKTSQVFVLSPNEIPTQPLKYSRDPSKLTSHNHLNYFPPGKPIYPPDHLQYLSPPLSNEAFTRLQESLLSGSGGQRNTKELFYSKPYLGPKENPWLLKQKPPTIIHLPSNQEVPWSVVPLPPPLPTLHMGASDSEYTWALRGLPPPLQDNSFNKADSSDFSQNLGNNEYLQNFPIEHNEQYFNKEQPTHRPFVYNNENYKSNYKPQTFGDYNFENSVTAAQSTIEENDSEEDNNNSEENDGREERTRPNDPIHNDADSKEHYLNNGNQHYIDQKYQYQIPNNNEFVQNIIRLPQKIPKIEKLRVTNEFTNVNVNQYNKYHPDNIESHFLPTPTNEPQITSTIKYKGKARTLVFTPSQRDPFSNNIQISTPSYSLPEPTVTPHGLQSSTFSPTHFSPTLQSSTVAPPHFAQNIQSSTLAPSHFSPTPSSISEHPLPLLSPQQFLTPTTPFTPHYSTSRPEDQSQFISPEKDHFLQIQTPIPTTYGQFQPQLHNPGQPQLHNHGQPQLHNHGQPQLAPYEEPRPQFYVNQQNPFEIPQEHQTLNNVPIHQQLVENFVPTQGYIQHQIPRPNHQAVHQLPLGFPSNPELQNFDPHNPQANPIHLHQPQVNYSPNEQYHIPEHPLLEEHQYIPLQNLNSPGRMIHAYYPHKKSDENLSQEQDGQNDDQSREYQASNENKNSINQYQSQLSNEYISNSNERNINLMSNEENFEPHTSQTESFNTRTDSKIQFDYVDSKTRIQPHGVKVIEENLKLEESRHGARQHHEIGNKEKPSVSNNNIDKDQKFQKINEQNIGPPVDNFVQKYVEDYNNQQETKQNDQISDPDFVIQKSLGTEYQLFSKEDENQEEENHFVPRNFVTSTPINYVTPIPNNEEATSNVQNNKVVNEKFQTFQLNDRNPQSDNPNKMNANLIDLNTRETNFHNGLQSPQVQHNHFTHHISGANNLHVQQLKGNKIPISTQNNPLQQPFSNDPFQQLSSNNPFQQPSRTIPSNNLLVTIPSNNLLVTIPSSKFLATIPPRNLLTKIPPKNKTYQKVRVLKVALSLTEVISLNLMKFPYFYINLLTPIKLNSLLTPTNPNSLLTPT
ncbi:hypothetical protein WDU94_002357 [Cyamophila willieti]